MHSRLQTPRPPRLQDPIRLLDSKRPAITKHIAKLCQPALADMRQHLLLHQLNVLLRSARLSSKLLRNHMRAKKRGHNFQWLLGGQLFLKPQNLQFARNVQPVPALCFNRCRPVRRELFQRRQRALLQSLTCCLAQPFHRVENPAALPRNFFVARPGNLQFILFRTACGMHQVRMRVHKSRQRPCNRPLSVREAACLFLNLSPSALSTRFSSRTQSPRDIPHPRAVPRPSRDHSSARVRCASPFPSFRPRPSLAPNVANSQSPPRRRCGSTPTTPRSLY